MLKPLKSKFLNKQLRETRINCIYRQSKKIRDKLMNNNQIIVNFYA